MLTSVEMGVSSTLEMIPLSSSLPGSRVRRGRSRTLAAWDDFSLSAVRGEICSRRRMGRFFAELERPPVP